MNNQFLVIVDLDTNKSMENSRISRGFKSLELIETLS